MIIALIVFILLFLLVFLLFIPVIIQTYISNNEITIKLILLKVIKINIKEKTILEKLKKDNKIKAKVPLKKIIEIVTESFPSIRYLACKTEVNIKVNGTFGFSSADKTALTIGIINILLYNLGSIIENYFKKYTGEYNIIPDFVYEVLVYSISAEVRILPVNIIIFLIKWLKVLLKYKKYILRKGGASNAGSSNRRIDENYNG
jgi:hypothetical protein